VSGRKPLHPALAQRAAATKAAHAALVKSEPGFRSLPAREQFQRVQRVLRAKGGQ
jgi:hypothetical protein